MKHEIGKRVRITQDCRAGSPATGAYGIYEGDFPISAIINMGDNYREVDYEEFIEWNEKQENPIPSLIDLVAKEPKYEGPMEDWKPKKYDFPVWFPHTNPRIRLDDGSTILGCECWWAVIDNDDPPLDELKKAEQETISALKGLVDYIADKL